MSARRAVLPALTGAGQQHGMHGTLTAALPAQPLTASDSCIAAALLQCQLCTASAPALLHPQLRALPREGECV